MSLLLCTVAAALVLSASASELSAGEAPKAGIYTAEGAAIVGRSARRFHNRPLYCNKIAAVVMAGDLPHIQFAHDPCVCGCLMMAVDRGGKAKWLHDFATVVSKYHDAHVTWEVSDPSLPGLALVLDVLPTAEGPGFCARLAVQGAKPGDRLIWAYGGATPRPGRGSGTVLAAFDPMVFPDLMTRGFVPEDCKGNSVSINGDQFLVSPPHEADKPAKQTIAGRCSQASSSLVVADAKAWADPAALTTASEKPELPIAVGITPLSGKMEVFWAVGSFDGEKVGDDSSIRQPAAAFEAGMRRAEAVGRRTAVDTPDKRFDATVAAACALTDGLIRPPQIMHGGMSWNMPYMGWRTMYGTTALGLHDIVKQAAALYINTQEKTDTKKLAHADKALGYTAEAMDSRFYGLGHLNHGDQWRYDMQSMLFDMVIHAWRWTGDPELEKLLRDGLDLHLQWMKDCFDPDGDGVYESYQNVAEVDQVWYNGGGTAEETAYAYNGHMAAIELARMAGNAEALSHHEKEAGKIRRGFIRGLWIQDKGYVGAYREQIGLKRLHEDSWLYSIFMPIDAGLLVDREPAQALHYTEWGMERVKMPLGGERCWTSNWIPTTWSSRMLWGGGHSYSLALAYCQAGLADEAWEMMKGGFLESSFNYVTPGGFDCSGVGMDFHDISSTFGRAAVEGVFGYVPDYPSGVVRCAPRFPSKWDHASITTPDFSLTFKRGKGTDEYAFKLTKTADIAFSVPVRARKVVSVEVDGKPAEWQSAPGYGHSVVSVKLPKRDSARLSVKWADALPQSEPVAIQGTVGQPIKLRAKNGTIVKLEDPQQVLSDAKIGDDAATAVLTSNAGHHLVTALVDVGGLKQWQLFKLTVADPKAESEAAAKLVDKIPGDAKWACVDMKGSFNGDIKTIYKQEYLSPRPQTCSVRIGSDGFNSWPFYFWGVKTPAIDLSNVSKMLDTSGRLVTPQGAQFAWGSEDKNIAFTSQWDNWPRSVTIPVGKTGKAVWLLVCGSTNQMQGKITNAEISLKYADGSVEKLDLVPPYNFWSLCGIPDGKDYDTTRDAFALPKTPPATVQLGANCRAIVLNRRLRDGATLDSVTLETLSQEVVIGLMGVTVME